MGVFCGGFVVVVQICGMFLISLEIWKLQSVASN